MFINYVAMIVALSISVVSGYYSIIGLATIFSSAFWPIIMMGCVLEAGKLTTASWLYNNWNTAPRMLRYYLTTIVVVLMFISSMGIFGFLSKAHIEQTSMSGGQTIVIESIQLQIDQENRTIKNAQRALDSMNTLVEQATPKEANYVRNSQKKERAALNTDIEEAAKNIQTLNEKLLPLKMENSKVMAEVGPIKYISDLIYGESEEKNLEAAVRWVILVLVFVFDPLAVLLLIAANNGIKENNRPRVGRPRKKSLTKFPFSNILQISDDVFKPRKK